MTPTARTLKELERRGYTAAVVEKWNPWARVRQDLFGFADVIGFKAGEPVLLVQTTTRTNASARRKKIRDNPTASAWLAAGHRIEVHGWFKDGRRWAVAVTDIQE